MNAQHPFKDLEGGPPAWIARAPGCLDLMGGIAEYCGSLVLEVPLNLSAWVALVPWDQPVIEIRHVSPPAKFRSAISFNFSALFDMKGAPLPAARLRSMLNRDRASAWTGHLLGVFQMALLEGWIKAPKTGARLMLFSELPMGAGAASSAAIEVAALQAMGAAWGFKKDGAKVAELAQSAENQVLQPPCGATGHACSLLGRKDKVFMLRSRPFEAVGQLSLPVGIGVFGINSGVRHSTGGSAYAAVRVAARMAEAILGAALGQAELQLSRLSLQAYESGLRSRLPESMDGQAFLDAYGPLADDAVGVDPYQIYRIRACADHHVREGGRAERFSASLTNAGTPGQDAATRASSLRKAGALMLESHNSYSENCLLGTAETELIVERAMTLGSERGVYGAKVSGSGAGGTVVILAEKSAEPALRRIAQDFEAKAGPLPNFFSGSSEGALATAPFLINGK